MRVWVVINPRFSSLGAPTAKGTSQSIMLDIFPENGLKLSKNLPGGGAMDALPSFAFSEIIVCVSGNELWFALGVYIKTFVRNNGTM